VTTHFESGDDAVTTHRAFLRFCDDIICARRLVDFLIYRWEGKKREREREFDQSVKWMGREDMSR